MKSKNHSCKAVTVFFLWMICLLLAAGQGREAGAITVQPPEEVAPPPPAKATPAKPKPKPRKKTAPRPEPEEEAPIVKPATPPPEPPPRFTASSDGVIRDAKTGLEWYVGPDQDTTWYEASDFAKRLRDLNVAGGGWTIPNLKELVSILGSGVGGIGLDPLFKGICCWMWSLELWNQDNAIAISTIGVKGAFPFDERIGMRALAVRSRR